MNRRQAIQSITLLTLSSPFLIKCQAKSIRTFSKMPIDEKDFQMVESIAQIIIPKNEELEIVTPESTADYIFTNVNDCHSPESIDKFLNGIKKFQVHLSGKEDKKVWFHKQQDEKREASFDFLMNSDEEDIAHFYQTTKGLSQSHFTTSEYFMTNILDYEFIPGRYNGCIPI